MNTWMLNVSPGHARYDASDKKAQVIIRSSDPQINIADGDAFITLDRDPAEQWQDAFKLLNYGRVKDVSDGVPVQSIETGLRGRDKKIYNHYLDLHIDDNIKERPYLDDYTYSLTNVYRFNDPSRHFRRQYTSLSENDYETIKNQWVYVARTIFGRLVNALPQENKMEFVLLATAEFQTHDLRKVRYSDALQLLREYIEEHILNYGRLLVESHNMLRSDFEGVIPLPNAISFRGEGENDKADRISTQAGLFRELFSIDNGFNAADELMRGKRDNNDIEQRFSAIFNKRAWPIDFTI